ncbi:MAG: alpha/beta hydrolase [Candidatus Saccharimonas sp.]
MSHSVTLTNGTRVRYYTYRDDKQPTIVMIHGITGNHKGFQYILPELSDYHCIVPDLPGFGDSDLPPKANWSVDDLARLANEFVAALKLPVPPIILGHSMGGLVVSSMVSQRPELYNDRVVLISPVPTAVRRRDSRYIGAKLGALQYRAGQVSDRIVKNATISRATTSVMIKTRDHDRRRAIYDHHLDNLRYFSDSGFYHALHTDINRRGSIDYAPALQHKKILLLAGDDDLVTPLAEMNKFAQAITPHTYQIIPNVGHLIHYEKAPEASRAIRQFLDE